MSAVYRMIKDRSEHVKCPELLDEQGKQIVSTKVDQM